jgi:hypothetical protein
MKTKLPLVFSISGFLFCSFTYAQSYIGLHQDHYSGIQGIILNPAAVVDSRQRADINLLSVSAFGGSHYFSTGLGNLLESEDGLVIDEELEKFPADDNQFFLNVDALGPSFMFNLTRSSSLGVTTRVRAFLNLNNLNGTLYENITEDFDSTENFDFDLENFSGTVHAWSEIGLTYGRILVDNQQNFLKGGITLKYLQGAGSTFVNAPSASGQYDAATEILMTSGMLSYGSSPGFEGDDIDFENLSSGFGGDIGLVYEYRPGYAFDTNDDLHSNYQFRIGISVTDIGSISYADSELTHYDLTNSLSSNVYEDTDLEKVLEENFEGTEEIIEARINLPAAMHAFVDYKLKKRMFISLQGSLSLVNDSREQANRIINNLSATPRYQSRWFSFYLPLSIRQYDGFSMGAGLRLGPLSVGSGSIISNYISDSSKTTDLYVGLKIPIYR